jgi:hypothetical protein
METVTMWRCPICGNNEDTLVNFPCDGFPQTAGHKTVERELVQFVRVSDVVAALEGLAANQESASLSPLITDTAAKAFRLAAINTADIIEDLTPDTEED